MSFVIWFVPEERKLDNPFVQCFIIVGFHTIISGRFNYLAELGGWALTMQQYIDAMVN